MHPVVVMRPACCMAGQDDPVELAMKGGWPYRGGGSRVIVCLESCCGTPWCVRTKGLTNKTSEVGECS